MKNGGSRHILGARLPLFCMFRRMCCERGKKNAAYSRCFVSGIGLLAFVCLCGVRAFVSVEACEFVFKKHYFK